MPFLDLSELTYDADFCDTFNILRRTQRTGTNGQPVIAAYVMPITGMVQPTSGALLERLPDASRMSASVELVTSTRLLAITSSNIPDILAYQGKSYIVHELLDYGSFGSGLFLAVCVLTDLITGMTINESPDVLADTIGSTFILGTSTLAAQGGALLGVGNNGFVTTDSLGNTFILGSSTLAATEQKTYADGKNAFIMNESTLT